MAICPVFYSGIVIGVIGLLVIDDGLMGFLLFDNYFQIHIFLGFRPSTQERLDVM